MALVVSGCALAEQSRSIRASTQRRAVPECQHERVRPTVLVVDDHADFRASVRDLLQTGGWEVVADVGDSSGAMSAVHRLRPQVVLLDICLAADDPGGDGIDLAHALAELPESPSVVLVSARSATTFGDRLAHAPVSGFVPKSQLTSDALTLLVGRG
jgi:DNA-binding NarL/FixJ family response regulator